MDEIKLTENNENQETHEASLEDLGLEILEDNAPPLALARPIRHIRVIS
ncbi:hypothetical protein HZU77_001410 [Neisseriaceae bacterium TC5R-5]|nr:hypothetical protein [Neisseriaceae bacterium TC5R-5]